jgi:hypothetical protein
MAYAAAENPHNKIIIPPNSSAGVLVKPGPGAQLLAIFNCSATAQSNAVSIYDAPSVALAGTSGYPPLYQPLMSAAQILDMTILKRSFNFAFGIVAIPRGGANSDGGWMFIYL